MATLLDIIPYTGFGSALFPYLNEQELERLKLTCKTLKADVEEQRRLKNQKPTPPQLAIVRKHGKMQLQVEKSQKKDKLFDVETTHFSINHQPLGRPIGVTEYMQQLKSLEIQQGKQSIYQKQNKERMEKRLNLQLQAEFSFTTKEFHYENQPQSVSIMKDEYHDFQKNFQEVMAIINQERLVKKKKKAVLTELINYMRAVEETKDFGLYTKASEYRLGLRLDPAVPMITAWNIHECEFELIITPEDETPLTQEEQDIECEKFHCEQYRSGNGYDSEDEYIYDENQRFAMDKLQHRLWKANWGSFKIQWGKTWEVDQEKVFQSKTEANVWRWKFCTQLLPLIWEERDRLASQRRTVRLNPNFKGTWKQTWPWKKRT